MMWDQVLERVVAVVQSDSILRAIVGANNMRMGGTGEHQVPSLEWHFIGDAQSELWSPVIIQFDLWHANMSKIVEGERRLRTLFDAVLPVEFDGLQMTAIYLDGDVLASTNRNGFNGRAVRFTFTPLRSRYALSTL